MVTVTDSTSVTAGSTAVKVPFKPSLSLMAVAGPNPPEVTKGTSCTIMPAGGVGTIVCSWAFGDITTGSGCSTTHTYAATRSFTANVTAIDGLGVTATGSVYLTVNAKLTVTVAASSNPAAVGSAVGFAAHATSGVGVATCKWTFGDGATGTGCTTTHPYTSQGRFLETVHATTPVNL